KTGEAARLKFTASAEDTRMQGQALTAASIIVHSGLWLVYSKPFFDDDPYVLEPGGYPNLKAWGAKDPSICSMHPIRLVSAGCWSVTGYWGAGAVSSPGRDRREHLPVVPGDPSLPASGSWAWPEVPQTHHVHRSRCPKLLPPSLGSLRPGRTPAVCVWRAPGPRPFPPNRPRGSGRGGSWVAYEGTNFSGEQYILEKGVYRSCEDWGAADCRIASAQPILQVRAPDAPSFAAGPYGAAAHGAGGMDAHHDGRVSLGTLLPASWILFDGQAFAGEQHVLSEGEYPTLSAMGCLSSTAICSLKKVPVFFSEPSIFLHGLECFEGKEIELNNEVRSLQAEGFNNHVLSVRVKGGMVLPSQSHKLGEVLPRPAAACGAGGAGSRAFRCEKGFSLFQRRIYFRIRSRELELYLSVPDDVEDMKAGRVVVSSLSEQSSSVWYYEDGLMKNQVAPNMSLQVIGPAGKGAKAVLWSETRMPRQTWSVDSQGRIHSQMFEDMILDIKGGRSYDRDHAIIWDVAEERPTQIWDVQVL
ncbi:Absent in melanoma 1-like, partial [Pygoscelis adeliae]